MSNHTPGPWKADDLRVMWGGYFVADCDGKGDIGRKNESRANAQLIAAAPELLAQAQLAVTALQKAGVHPSYYAGLLDAINSVGKA